MARSTHSQVSIREHSIPSGYLTTSASCSGGMADQHNMIYSQVSKRDELQQQQQLAASEQYHYASGAASSSVPTFQRQLTANTSTEFDNYSQVLSDDYEEDAVAAGYCDMMNYGDIDVTSHHHHHHTHHHPQQHMNGQNGRYSNAADTTSLPYSLKTSTQHGSIVASSQPATGTGHLYSNASQHASDNSLKNMYRAVEYKKGSSRKPLLFHLSFYF